MYLVLHSAYLSPDLLLPRLLLRKLSKIILNIDLGCNVLYDRRYSLNCFYTVRSFDRIN